jgi:fructose-1-phosphate kinase PfkB-like protein
MRGQSFSSFVISATIALVSGVGAGVAVTAVVVVVFALSLGVQLTAPIARSVATSAICVNLLFFIN